MTADIPDFPRALGADQADQPQDWAVVGSCSIGCMIMAQADMRGYLMGVGAVLCLALALLFPILLLPA